MESGRRALLFEALEDRTLLSVAPVMHSLAQGYRPAAPVSAHKAIPAPVGTTLVKPSIVSASALGHTRSITVTWKSVSGASGYVLERSADGNSWTTAQTIAAGSTSAVDSGLAENTVYRYRLRALSGGDISDPSNVLAARTEAFKVFDATLYNNRPAGLGTGIPPVYVSYGGPVDPSGQPDETATRALARTVADQGQMLILDIETWQDDIRQVSTLEVNRTIAKFLKIFDWARSERPNLKIGVYGNWPLSPFETPQTAAEAQALTAANDYLISRLAPSIDFVAPGMYAAFTDPGDWQAWANVMLNEARRYGKPVYSFVWMNYNYPPYGAVPMDYWKLMLGTVRAESDGVMVWGGYGENWNENAPWWQATQSFMTESPAVPAAPSDLKINPTGAILSWTGHSTNESGFQVERSSDGVHFGVVGATGAGTTTWHDSRIASGQVYFYRVSALSAWGNSAVSNVVSATVARNALVLNQAEGFEQSLGVSAGLTTALSLDAGDWILYRNVDFGARANQFDLRIAVPQVNAGQKIEIHLDSVNGPLIGMHAIFGSTGYADMSVQSSAIMPTSGVHDVYLVFKARADGNGSGAGNFDWFMFASNAPPAPPTRLTANSQGGHVSLAWGDNSADEDGFIIERSGDGVNFAPLANVGANVTSYDDGGIGLKLGVTYSYRVRAFNAYGQSDASNVDQGKRGTRNAHAIIKAMDNDVHSDVGILNSSTVGFIDQGDYIGFLGVDFGQGVNQVMARVGLINDRDGGQIQFRLDSVDGPVIGTLVLHGTGSYFNFTAEYTAVALTSGIHDLYLVFGGGYGILNLDWVSFSSGVG